MWFLVAFFNPLLSLLSLGTLPMHEILQNQASLLAWMAKRSGNYPIFHYYLFFIFKLI